MLAFESEKEGKRFRYIFKTSLLTRLALKKLSPESAKIYTKKISNITRPGKLAIHRIFQIFDIKKLMEISEEFREIPTANPK